MSESATKSSPPVRYISVESAPFINALQNTEAELDNILSWCQDYIANPYPYYSDPLFDESLRKAKSLGAKCLTDLGRELSECFGSFDYCWAALAKDVTNLHHEMEMYSHKFDSACDLNARKALGIPITLEAIAKKEEFREKAVEIPPHINLPEFDLSMDAKALYKTGARLSNMESSMRTTSVASLHLNRISAIHYERESVALPENCRQTWGDLKAYLDDEFPELGTNPLPKFDEITSAARASQIKAPATAAELYPKSSARTSAVGLELKGQGLNSGPLKDGLRASTLGSIGEAKGSVRASTSLASADQPVKVRPSTLGAAPKNTATPSKGSLMPGVSGSQISIARHPVKESGVSLSHSQSGSADNIPLPSEVQPKKYKGKVVTSNQGETRVEEQKVSKPTRPVTAPSSASKSPFSALPTDKSKTLAKTEEKEESATKEKSKKFSNPVERDDEDEVEDEESADENEESGDEDEEEDSEKEEKPKSKAKPAATPSKKGEAEDQGSKDKLKAAARPTPPPLAKRNTPTMSRDSLAVSGSSISVASASSAGSGPPPSVSLSPVALRAISDPKRASANSPAKKSPLSKDDAEFETDSSVAPSPRPLRAKKVVEEKPLAAQIAKKNASKAKYESSEEEGSDAPSSATNSKASVASSAASLASARKEARESTKKFRY